VKTRLIKRLIYKLKESFKKGKYRSILLFILSPSYRKDVLYVNRLISCVDRDRIVLEISLEDVCHGHTIVYPLWVKYLVKEIKTKGYTKLPMIDVIWDARKGKWLVTDGNHRLAALRKALHPAQRIHVNVLIARGLFPKAY